MKLEEKKKKEEKLKREKEEKEAKVDNVKQVEKEETQKKNYDDNIRKPKKENALKIREPYKPNILFSSPTYQKLADFDKTLDIFSDKGFPDFNLHPIFTNNLMEYMKLEKPTKIQQLAIQVLLKSRDVMIKAHTGSGKTLAFLIPIIQDLLNESSTTGPIDRSKGTCALIISPTRELSLQIYEVLRKALRPFPKIVPGLIVGGEKRKSEKARLRKGITILISTPGRLSDHLKNTVSFNLSNCRWLVLDEADRLLELGFENDIRFIIETLNSKMESSYRRSVLASATLNKNVDRLALLSLKDPVFISLDQDPNHKENENQTTNNHHHNEESLDISHEIPSTLTQHVTVVEPKRKLITLISFLRWILKTPNMKIILFFSSCDSVEFYYMLFSMVELPVSLEKDKIGENERLINAPLFKLHGQLTQEERRSTFQTFSNSSGGVLMCTDVAARGLDIPQINWIIQYDVPTDPKAYIHRIGRTARIGSKGDALLMLMPSEEEYLSILEKSNMKFNKISSDEILSKLKTNLEINRKNNPDIEVGALQFKLISTVDAGGKVDLKSLAIRAFQSFIKSYATHSKITKHIFHVKNLHLGHICKNFVLKETPSNVARMLGKHVKEKKEKVDEMKEKKKMIRKKAEKNVKTSFTDEFSSGF